MGNEEVSAKYRFRIIGVKRDKKMHSALTVLRTVIRSALRTLELKVLTLIL